MIRPLRTWHRRVFVTMLALPLLMVLALAQRPDAAFWPREAASTAPSGVHARWLDDAHFELTANPPLQGPDPLVYVVAADGTAHLLGSFDGVRGRYTSAARGELRILSGVDHALLAQLELAP